MAVNSSINQKTLANLLARLISGILNQGIHLLSRQYRNKLSKNGSGSKPIGILTICLNVLFPSLKKQLSLKCKFQQWSKVLLVITSSPSLSFLCPFSTMTISSYELSILFLKRKISQFVKNLQQFIMRYLCIQGT